MDLTTSQLSQLRTRPHRSRLWLSVFRPQVVLEARINQPSVAMADRDITITVLSGDVDDIEGDETMFIGTSQGSKDLDRIRIRSGAGTVLTLAENSITWVDGWYLTVVRYFEPWGVFPRIFLNNQNVPQFRKDWDIEYTDQNQEMDPVVLLGPNHAGFLQINDAAPTGTHLVWYTSSGTFNPTVDAPAITGSTFNWQFEGGDPPSSSALDPGYVSYTGVGNFVTSLTVTTEGGASHTGRRHINILSRPEAAGGNKPYARWGFNSLEGSRSNGGYTTRIWARDVVDFEEIVDGALVVIFSEDFEGEVETKVGANAENRDSTFFVGYILGDSISYDAVTNEVDFRVGSITTRMTELSTFSSALDDKTTAASWTDMREMTVDRALIHYLRWHATILAVADFRPTQDQKSVEFIDFSRGNIFDASRALLDSALFGNMVSDRQGKIWAEINASMQPTGSARQADDLMQEVITITRQDWRGEIDIEREPTAKLAYTELGGIAYSGESTGTFDPYLSGAPGEAPEYSGGVQRRSGLVVLGQEQINELSGLQIAMENALYPNLDMSVAGDYRFLDIAPQQRVLLDVAKDETFRRITLNSEPFIPELISYNYEADRQALMMNMVLVPETSGPPGVTVEIPVDPPYDEIIIGDFDIEFPPIIPPIIEPPIPPPDTPSENIYAYTVIHTNANRGFSLQQTRALDAIPPTWATIMNAGIDPTGTVTGALGMFKLDISDPATTGFLITETAVWMSTNLNAADVDDVTFVEVLTLEDMRTLVGEPAAYFMANERENDKGIVDLSLARYGFVCTLAFNDAGGGRANCFFVWTEFVFGGPIVWNFLKLTHTGSSPSDEHRFQSGSGPSCIQALWHPAFYGKAYVSGFRTTTADQNTLLWEVDFLAQTGEAGTKSVPHYAFENIQQHTIMISKLRNPDARTIYAANKRADPRARRSLNAGAGGTWTTFGQNPSLASHALAGNENLQERYNAFEPEVYLVGETIDASFTAITRYRPSIDEFSRVVSTEPSQIPPWVTTGNDIFLGYGFFIWPFDESFQWIADGNDNTTLYETRDGWNTVRDVSDPTWAANFGGDRRLRFTQVCWKVVPIL